MSTDDIYERIFIKEAEKYVDIRYLSINKYLTWDNGVNLVQSNPNIKWEYYLLSQNTNITWDIVSSHPDKPWNYSFLSENPNITWDNGVNLIQSNPGKEWNYYFL